MTQSFSAKKVFIKETVRPDQNGLKAVPLHRLWSGNQPIIFLKLISLLLKVLHSPGELKQAQLEKMRLQYMSAWIVYITAWAALWPAFFYRLKLLQRNQVWLGECKPLTNKIGNYSEFA